MTATESTSAALRRVEQERDELVDRLKQMTAFRAEAIDAVRRVAGARDLLQAELASARAELDAVRTARDTLDRELSAERELAVARVQVPQILIVARDGGRNCERCEQEVRRGEAYELMSGADQLQHIHCRDRTEENETA